MVDNDISTVVGIFERLTITGVFIILWLWERGDRKYWQQKTFDLLKIMAGLNIPHIRESLRDMDDKPPTISNRDNAHAQER